MEEEPLLQVAPESEVVQTFPPQVYTAIFVHVELHATPAHPVDPGRPEVVIAAQPDPEFRYRFPFELEVTLTVPSVLIADPQFVTPIVVLDQSVPEFVDVYTHDSSLTPATQVEPSVLVASELKLGP